MLKRRRNLTWRIFKMSSHAAVKFTNMETEKIGHILKGIADDTFNLRICENYDSVDTIIKESCNFELMKSHRIAQQFNRLPNTASMSSCEDQPLGPHLPGQGNLT